MNRLIGTIGLFCWLGASMASCGLHFHDPKYWIILVPIALFNSIQVSGD